MNSGLAGLTGAAAGAGAGPLAAPGRPEPLPPPDWPRDCPGRPCWPPPDACGRDGAPPPRPPEGWLRPAPGRFGWAGAPGRAGWLLPAGRLGCAPLPPGRELPEPATGAPGAPGRAGCRLLLALVLTLAFVLVAGRAAAPCPTLAAGRAPPPCAAGGREATPAAGAGRADEAGLAFRFVPLELVAGGAGRRRASADRS